jgi:glycosyltransferase involved in cell wall biosynthesis
MKLLTILTPTYNRANLLRNAYESLLRQTNKDFYWLIIDDGSSDNTRELIAEFQKENLLQIQYEHKENGGKHTALNIGFDLADSDLILILDSDDYLTDDAVQTVADKWKKWRDQPNIGQICFLSRYPGGKILHKPPCTDEYIYKQKKGNSFEKLKGDMCNVLRTSAIKKYKFPVFENEKYIGLSVLYNKYRRIYDSVYYHDVIYVAEYQPEGLSKSGRILRIKNPLGGMLYANERIKNDYKIKTRFKSAVLFGVYSFFSKTKVSQMLRKSNAPFLSFICLPASFMLYLYWKGKYKS